MRNIFYLLRVAQAFYLLRTLWNYCSSGQCERGNCYDFAQFML